MTTVGYLYIAILQMVCRWAQLLGQKKYLGCQNLGIEVKGC